MGDRRGRCPRNIRTRFCSARWGPPVPGSSTERRHRFHSRDRRSPHHPTAGRVDRKRTPPRSRWKIADEDRMGLHCSPRSRYTTRSRIFHRRKAEGRRSQLRSRRFGSSSPRNRSRTSRRSSTRPAPHRQPGRCLWSRRRSCTSGRTPSRLVRRPRYRGRKKSSRPGHPSRVAAHYPEDRTPPWRSRSRRRQSPRT